MTADLKQSCQKILRRLQQNDIAEYSCVLCPHQVRGQDALMQHCLVDHAVYTVHFDDVVDLDGFLATLKERLHRQTADLAVWTCPVCEHDTASASVAFLEEHMKTTGHNRWTLATIPELAEWCVVIDARPAADTATGVDPFQDHSGAATEEEGDDDTEAWGEDEEEDDDWDEECSCLFCDFYGTDVLSHMQSSHSFDFRQVVVSRSDIKTEYDLVRVVNMIRRAVAQHTCPCGSSCTLALTSGDEAADQLEVHLSNEPSHRLPQTLSSDDADLIPFLPGDSLLTMLMASEGFLPVEDADPDYPMVPTVQQLVAAAAAAGKGQ